MFRANTILVLGAGASAEVGLPIGSGLLAQIRELLDAPHVQTARSGGDEMIVRALKAQLGEDGTIPVETGRYLAAARQIVPSSLQALSIDNVIDALEDPCVELVGKLAIARAILKAELSSKHFTFMNIERDASGLLGDQSGMHNAINMHNPIHRTSEIDLMKFNDTWYSHLSKLLTENVRKSGVADLFCNLEIINFNYDRCLETYLSYSLAKYYGMSIADARSLVSQLVVHRPYGMVGRLPWQPGAGPAVPFGGGSHAELIEAAGRIRTFTEQVNDGTEIDAIRQALSNADRVVFLGFAFHRQNVALLETTPFEGKPEILATAYDVSFSDQAVIREEVAAAFSGHGAVDPECVQLANLTCHDLFRDYWRTLTAARRPG